MRCVGGEDSDDDWSGGGGGGWDEGGWDGDEGDLIDAPRRVDKLSITYARASKQVYTAAVHFRYPDIPLCGLGDAETVTCLSEVTGDE